MAAAEFVPRLLTSEQKDIWETAVLKGGCVTMVLIQRSSCLCASLFVITKVKEDVLLALFSDQVGALHHENASEC